MSLTLRPYKPLDAAVITSWLKSEYLMHQWCADRYEHYPVTPEDMNTYHAKYIDGQCSRALTMVAGNEVVGFHRVARADAESYECLGETWNCIEMELFARLLRS